MSSKKDMRRGDLGKMVWQLDVLKSYATKIPSDPVHGYIKERRRRRYIQWVWFQDDADS